MTYCEDYPCCGHTYDDPCGRQPYDEPGYYDTSRPGNEHALCNHAEGECDVDYEPEYVDPDDCDHADYSYLNDGNVRCDVCYDTIGEWSERDDSDWPVAIMW